MAGLLKVSCLCTNDMRGVAWTSRTGGRFSIPRLELGGLWVSLRMLRITGGERSQ